MKNLRKNRNLMLGIIILLVVFIPAVLGMFWTPYDSEAMDSLVKNASPSFSHLLGTDNFGRDILSRIMEGAATTFIVGVCTVIIGAVFGTLIGAVTGYYGGVVDEILMRLNDGLTSFPSILLALIVVSIAGPGKYNIIIALGIVFIPSFARVIRSEVITKKEQDYVTNARLMGAGDFRIIFLHILPNTRGILLSTITIAFNNAILAEAGLSYLSLGVQPPDASLGRMLSEAQGYMISAPWYALAPGITIMLTVLGIGFISQGLEDNGLAPTRKRKKLLKALLINKASIETDKHDIVDNQNRVDNMDGICNQNRDDNRGTAGNQDRLNSQETEFVENKKYILDVRNLRLGFFDEEDRFSEVLRGISFDVEYGEILGIVGESGSGKSMTAFSVMNLLPEQAVKTDGSILFDGVDLEKLDAEERRKVSGFDMTMIFQEPMSSLNPVYTIGAQVDEMLRIHEGESNKQRVLEALEETGLEEVEELYDKYPFELSGGMRQRVMIAMAMICSPKLLIADEPTTALDVTLQMKILKLLKELNEKHGTTIILISHDLNVINSICTRAMVMEKGLIVEEGSTHDILYHPKQEYTKALMAAAGREFRKDRTDKTDRTDMANRLGEADRVDKADRTGGTDKADVTDKVNKTDRIEKPEKNDNTDKNENAETIISIRNLNLFYEEEGKHFYSRKVRHQVGKNMNLDIGRGEVFGIVGESGSGKSSLVKAIAGIDIICEGSIEMPDGSMPQMVFQDPYGSLNPSMKVGRLLEEPLRINGGFTREKMKSKVRHMLKKVDLPEDFTDRRISELSGGQRQRVAIALALILKMDIIILDEPVSALDVTIQAQILDLLLRLRREYQITYIFVSHDIGLVKRICDRICVIKDGEIIEQGSAQEVFRSPKHEYTKELINCSIDW